MARIVTLLALLLCVAAMFMQLGGSAASLTTTNDKKTAADEGNSLFHFMSIGDWGCEHGEKAEVERTVAKSFAAKAAEVKSRFVLNTGDNFYDCGVHSKSDSVWKTTFEDVYHEESMMVPWYSCLGNHDYGYPGSAEAEMEYVSPKNNRWVMPSRYYYRRLVFPNEVNISLVVLDSSPCQAKYRSNDPSGWDPCRDEAHGCVGCKFHENVVAQSCPDQLKWLEEVLPKIHKDDWKIAMAHAPAYDLNVEDLLKPLLEHKFELFVNGHIHELSHYKMDDLDTMNFVTTGAGCQVPIVSAAALSSPPPPLVGGAAHKHENVWTQKVAGYTEHVFEDNYKTLATHFYNYKGEVIKRIAVNKR